MKLHRNCPQLTWFIKNEFDEDSETGGDTASVSSRGSSSRERAKLKKKTAAIKDFGAKMKMSSLNIVADTELDFSSVDLSADDEPEQEEVKEADEDAEDEYDDY